MRHHCATAVAASDRPAGAAGEDSDEDSEATDDQKRDEERGAEEAEDEGEIQQRMPHSLRVLRPEDLLKTVLKAVLRPEDFLKAVLKAVLRPAFC